jgi:hypothetical protein
VTQVALDFSPVDALLAKDTMCARVARLLLANRGTWVDGTEIARVGGAYAWRTRLSDLRKTPWCLTVENQMRHVDAGGGHYYKVSEYRIP